MDMTKSFVKRALDYQRDTQLAEFFGTSKQAVSQWGDDEPLPEGRQWQAMALRPDLFGPSTEARDEAA